MHCPSLKTNFALASLFLIEESSPTDQLTKLYCDEVWKKCHFCDLPSAFKTFDLLFPVANHRSLDWVQMFKCKHLL